MKTIISYLLASLLLAWSSSSDANELTLQALVPNHVGLTASRYASLCWILRGTPPDGATMRFTLTTTESITPLLEVDLPTSFLTENKETCQCAHLKDYGISLEPDVQYRWYVSVARTHESHARRLVAGGVIERCDLEQCMIIDFDQCDRDAVRSLARGGLWYDSISCLCDLIKSNPTDPTLRQWLSSFMNQGGGLPGGLIPLK